MKEEAIYLDNAAAMRPDDEVVEAMVEAQRELYANPSSSHVLGKRARRHIEAARSTIAAQLGCQAEDLIFTSGATEGNNLAVAGFAAHAESPCHLVTSQVEHKSVLRCMHTLETRGVEVTYVGVSPNGTVDPAEVLSSLKPETRLISLMLVNNETGVIQPVGEVAKLAKERGIVVHTDAAQAAGKLSLDVGELGVDLLTLAGHKLGGPRGIGVLYRRRSMAIEPLARGGSQEQGLRPGTENTPAVVGLAKAFELTGKKLAARCAQVAKLRDELEMSIGKALPDTVINGRDARRVASISSMSFPCVDGPVLHALLKRSSLCVTAGSACEAETLEPSHVLSAMGLQAELAEASVRFSFSHENTAEEAREAAAIVTDAVLSLQGAK